MGDGHGMRCTQLELQPMKIKEKRRGKTPTIDDKATKTENY